MSAFLSLPLSIHLRLIQVWSHIVLSHQDPHAPGSQGDGDLLADTLH